jgi:hypothetical protein
MKEAANKGSLLDTGQRGRHCQQTRRRRRAPPMLDSFPDRGSEPRRPDERHFSISLANVRFSPTASLADLPPTSVLTFKADAVYFAFLPITSLMQRNTAPI